MNYLQLCNLKLVNCKIFNTFFIGQGLMYVNELTKECEKCQASIESIQSLYFGLKEKYISCWCQKGHFCLGNSKRKVAKVFISFVNIHSTWNNYFLFRSFRAHQGRILGMQLIQNCSHDTIITSSLDKTIKVKKREIMYCISKTLSCLLYCQVWDCSRLLSVVPVLKTMEAKVEKVCENKPFAKNANPPN